MKAITTEKATFNYLAKCNILKMIQGKAYILIFITFNNMYNNII